MPTEQQKAHRSAGKYAASRCETLSVRGLTYNVRRWGDKEAPPLVLLHGTQDSSATFQFVIDNFEADWNIVAPDWRGHGHTEWAPRGYWFHEFVADLDAVLLGMFPNRPVPLLGHSLGGNIAGIYAGLRPASVSHVISLDGFGPLLNAVPVDIKAALRMGLDLAQSDRQHSPYSTIEEIADRLMRANRRLSSQQARFLAEHSTSVGADGKRRWLFDPAHRKTIPTLRDIQEWFSIWADITAPVCWFASSDERPHAPTNSAEVMKERAAAMRVARWVTLADTGHNIHHDAPAQVASAIEKFLAEERIG